LASYAQVKRLPSFFSSLAPASLQVAALAEPRLHAAETWW
jgi:hypothetical protein